MKKQLVRLLMLVFLVSSFFSSCGNKNQENYGSMTFDSIQVSRTVHLFNDTTAPSCCLTIQYTYPVKSATPGLSDSIRISLLSACFGEQYAKLEQIAAIDSFTNTYIREYKADLEPLYLKDKKNDPDGKDVQAWYSYYNNITATPLTDNEDVLVYKVEQNSYTGGAHGINSTLFLNFDAQTGKILHLKDIFKAGYEKGLNELLLAQLMKDKDVSTLEALQDKAYLLETPIYPSEDFFITSEGITFFYNVYEIAPYSNGTTEISLTNKKLKELIKE
ncbi:MAG: RsiV family protein [Bacteroides sp.]